MIGLMTLGCVACVSLGGSASLVAQDVIRAGDTITELNTTTETGLFSEEDASLLGKEVRRTVYAGQLIAPSNTRAPRLVTRNQMVTVKYVRGGLELSISGRAMGDASEGESVTVMNLQSRELIAGIVTKEGWVLTQ